jgi:hypothetical protein
MVRPQKNVAFRIFLQEHLAYINPFHSKFTANQKGLRRLCKDFHFTQSMLNGALDERKNRQ